MTLARLRIRALGIGVAAAIACAVGAVLQPREFLAAWLAAYVFWLSIPLGALALLLIHDLTGGRWRLTIGPALAAATASMPFFVLAFIPILLRLPLVFPWARPEEAALLPNTFYLNEPFFIGRFALYCIVWNLFAFLSLRFSPLDADGARGAMNWISAVGLILLGFSVTFASFDWIMSLEPHWSSTMFGMLTGSSQFIVALAFAILAALQMRTVSLPGEGPLGDRFHDLGSILLAVILFWAYTEFMQLLIIWEENLREEIGWYLKRMFGAWGDVMLIIALCQFVIPFLALIWSPVKRSRPALAAICGLLLATGLVHIWWLILPDLGGFGWLDPIAALAAGGLWFAFFLWRLERGRLVPGWRWPAMESFGRRPSHG